MSDAGSSAVKRRILVAIDTSPLAHLAIEVAALLADDLRGDVEGVFYEDAQLLKLSGLPFVRETGSTISGPRRLDPLTMQRRLHARAEEIREFLQRQCTPRKLSWSLTTLRERAAKHVSQSAQDVDLVVIGVEGRQPRISVQLRERRRPRHPVVVAYDGSAAARRALELGARAAAAGSQLVVVPVAETEEEAQRRTLEALRLIPTARGAWTTVRAVEDLVDVVKAHCGELLICPSSSIVTGELSLQTLVDRLDCPVALVR